MNEKSLVPKLRFKGFSGAWEQRELKEAGSLFDYGLNVASIPFDGKNKYLRITDIDDDSRAFSQNAPTSPDTNLTLASNYRLQEGDIVFARTGATVGKTYSYNKNDGLVFFAGFLIRVRIKPEYNAEFVFQSTLTNQYKNFISITSQRSGQPGVNAQEYASFKFFAPSYKEQSQIGIFLGTLDRLITLHQRKCEALKNVKKSLLEKMFPKNGEQFPALRFSGFNDAWEQRKLGEVFEEYSQKGFPELPVLTIIQGGGTIRRDKSERSLQYDKTNLSGYKMVNHGDFIVHLRSFEGGLELATSNGIISPAYHTFHGINTDSRFYYSYFRSQKFIKIDLSPHVYGIRDGRSIDIAGMKTIGIPYTNFKEQRLIGEFIGRLDRLITLHQRKCEALKNIKKSLLEKMFV